MNYRQFRDYVCSDLYRYSGELSSRAFRSHWRHEPGFRISFLFRFCKYLSDKPLAKLGLYQAASYLYNRNCVRYGVHLNIHTKVGPGFYLSHPCAIIINDQATIGRNCNISQSVTLGVSNRGEHKGFPEIGDEVFIGPGAVILGGIKIGNRAAIGANAVVTKDVPEGAVAAGVPAKIISQSGSADYINLVWPQSQEIG